MFTAAFIEQLGGGRIRHEEKLVADELQKRGIPVSFYTAKKILRRQLPLGPNVFIMGDIDAMNAAMKQLKIPVPAPNDYPASLTRFLHRRVWQTTLANVERQIQSGISKPVFVKPRERRKSFTGRVFSFSEDFLFVDGVSRREPVWCSEVVEWRAEYRVYVIGTEIVSTDCYDGNADEKLDMAAVHEAVAAYRAAGEAPVAYGIDFGVLESGETALVEANDGYALGAYKIDGTPYTDLLLERWRELLLMREQLS